MFLQKKSTFFDETDKKSEVFSFKKTSEFKKKKLSFIKKVKSNFSKNPVKPWQYLSSFTQKCENKLKTPLTPD